MNDEASSLEPPDVALNKLRVALQRGDRATVEALSSLLENPAPQALADVPLLGRLDATERDAFLHTVEQVGADARLAALQRRWSSLTAEVVTVHPRGATQAELIEHVVGPNGAPRFELSTLMDARSGAWRAVAFNQVLANRLTVWLPRPSPVDDPKLAPDEYRRDYELQWGEAATLALHPEGTLTVTSPDGELTGRFLPPSEVLRARGAALQRHQSILELQLELPDDIDQRLNRMTVFACAIWVFLRQSAYAVVIPEQDRLFSVWKFCQHVEAATQDIEQLARLWVSISAREGILRTSGLRFFHLPELELPIRGVANEEPEDFLWRTIDYLLNEGPVLKVGDTLGSPASPTHRVAPGMVGPTPGWSHGRAGSLLLHPLGS